MKKNNSKKFNLYIQGQRWAVRVWLILGILGSFSLHNVLGAKMSVSTALNTTVCCGLLLQSGTGLNLNIETESGPIQECDLRDQPSGLGRSLLLLTEKQAQEVYNGLPPEQQQEVDATISNKQKNNPSGLDRSLLLLTENQAQEVYNALPPEQQKRVKARIANKQKKNPRLSRLQALTRVLNMGGYGKEDENSAALPSPTLNPALPAAPAALSSPKPNPVPPAALRSPKPKPVPPAVTEPKESQSGAAVLLPYQCLYLLVIALILSQAF